MTFRYAPENFGQVLVLQDDFSDESVCQKAAVLSKIPPANRSSLLGRCALLLLLQEAFPSLQTDRILTKESSGQISLPKELGFCSISHDGPFAAAVLSAHPVGLDLLLACRDPGKAFCRMVPRAKNAAFSDAHGLWTCLEAYSKLLGCGLPLPKEDLARLSLEKGALVAENARFFTQKERDFTLSLAKFSL